ncbi:MAG: type II toxin-antitoxin system Phd/YefM family antitoxin [Burkholderiaceae bacterium]|nr:type II toxin-antitoxin system Phd/YefM family antitoxin [Burkholderiaceae bacterium]MDZ4162500.1 type II toxin-antitoxin system Phd/YefM family antitoxin [Burkholderiales bacterium]
MPTFTTSEAQRRFAVVLQTCELEPVFIRRRKQEVAVVMSLQAYERLTRLNVVQFQQFCDVVGGRAAQLGLTEQQLTSMFHD